MKDTMAPATIMKATSPRSNLKGREVMSCIGKIDAGNGHTERADLLAASVR
jgi:hypothetical protein